MSFRLFAVLIWLPLFALVSNAQIGIGETREDVLRQLGKPTSVAKRGNHEIFLYPKGGRIELIDGKVADVKGPLPEFIAPPTVLHPAGPHPAAPAPAAVTNPLPVPALPITSPLQSPGGSATPHLDPAATANELAKHVEKMDTPWGAAPSQPAAHSAVDSIPAFLVGLVLRFGITLLALKLAFKYWEMDAFWKGILAIAAIDLALHAGFELLGPVTSGFTTLAPVENGIPGLVLIYTINRFCFNKRLQNAVFTAAAVKVVVTLAYVFLALGLLNSLFG